MDADVKFAAARIERGSDLPLSDLATHLKLNNGELRLDPLRFGMAGGSLNAVVRLDGGKSRCAARWICMRANSSSNSCCRT